MLVLRFPLAQPPHNCGEGKVGKAQRSVEGGCLGDDRNFTA